MMFYYTQAPQSLPPDVEAGWLDGLHAKKRARAEKMKDKPGYALTLVSDRLVKFALRDFAGIEADGRDFRFSEHGKPYIDGGVFFNLSHSGQAAACAVGRSDVGADIERVHPVRIEVAERVLSPEELAAYKQAGCRPRHFCTLWALKESYIKYRGIGLGYPLKSLTFRLDADLTFAGANVPGVWFHTFDIPGYAAALCGQSPERPNLRAVKLYELVDQ